MTVSNIFCKCGQFYFRNRLTFSQRIELKKIVKTKTKWDYFKTTYLIYYCMDSSVHYTRFILFRKKYGLICSHYRWKPRHAKRFFNFVALTRLHSTKQSRTQAFIEWADENISLVFPQFVDFVYIFRSYKFCPCVGEMHFVQSNGGKKVLLK